jgi:hypothetical protein
MLGALIAHGRQAEVYAWDGGDAVVKLYRAGFDGHAAEAAALARLDGTGIAPRLLDMVTIDGRVGLVLQRVDGVDMLTLLQRQPWRLLGLARTLAHAAQRIHRVQARADLPDLIRVLGERIGAADLDVRRRDFALRILDTLPAGDRLCHGDFHPGNAVVTGDGTSIIDWPAATRGVPAADFARTMLLLRHADPLPGTPLVFRTLLSVGRRIFAGRVRPYLPQRRSAIAGRRGCVDGRARGCATGRRYHRRTHAPGRHCGCRQPRGGGGPRRPSGSGREIGAAQVAQHAVEDVGEDGQLRRCDVAENTGGAVYSLGAPPVQQGAALLGQRDLNGPPVTGMRHPVDQPRVKQDVDQAGHVPGRALEDLAQLALRERPTPVQNPQHLGPRGRQTVLDQAGVHQVA